jgi:small subunit ribosomal protein S6
LRAYELIYILDPALTEEQLSESVQRFAQIARDQGAEVDEPQRWPKRRLAYHIKGKGEGFYVVMTLRAEASAMKELTRILKLAEPVLRHMVVTPEEPKRPAEGAEAGVQ